MHGRLHVYAGAGSTGLWTAAVYAPRESCHCRLTVVKNSPTIKIGKSRYRLYWLNRQTNNLKTLIDSDLDTGFHLTRIVCVQ